MRAYATKGLACLCWKATKQARRTGLSHHPRTSSRFWVLGYSIHKSNDTKDLFFVLLLKTKATTETLRPRMPFLATALAREGVAGAQASDRWMTKTTSAAQKRVGVLHHQRTEEQNKSKIRALNRQLLVSSLFNPFQMFCVNWCLSQKGLEQMTWHH